MSFLNYIPGVAQAKANIHSIFNDEEGAARTLETYHTKTPIVAHLNAGIAKLFGDDETAKKCWDGGNSSLNALPVVGHVKGVGHYICGDIDGGDKAMVNATSTTLNMADGIPGVGHAKGVVHYVCGDVDGGNKAMKAATRNAVVMGAGAAGFLIAGPVGAVAGGVGAGAEWDLIAAAVTDGEEINGIAEIIDNPKNVDAYFNAGLAFVGDGMAGYAGGKIAKDVVRRVGNKAPGGNAGAAAAAGEAEAAAAQQLFEDLDAGKITYKEYQQKWNAMKPKGGFDNVKVNKDQLQSYYDKGIITKKQYNQAKKEMAAAGGKNVTVNVPLNQEPAPAPGARGKRPPRNQAKTSATGARGKRPPRNQAKTSATGASGSQPPQKPTENRILDPENISELRQRLTELLNRIRQFISRDDGRRWSHADIRQLFEREYFRQMYEIVSELISNGHSVDIHENTHLVISSPDGWREEIEHEVADILDVHYQLIGQRFDLDPASRGNRPPCPTVLSAEFQGSYLRLTMPENQNENHRRRGNFIYGIRCRLCDRQDGPDFISYVGQTTRSVHKRVCGEHARSVANAIVEEYDSEEEESDSEKEEYDSEEEEYDSEEADAIDEEYDSEEAPRRPMNEHANHHYQNDDVPSVTQPRNVFREVMDVIILPTGGQDDLRSWECFWQFFLHCREFFFGWSGR